MTNTTAKTHYFFSTADAYDAVMTGYNVEAKGVDCYAEDFDCESLVVNTGDILIIESEGVVGIASAWPFAITAERGCLSGKKNGSSWEDFLGFRKEHGEEFDTVESAIATASQLGYELADGLTRTTTAPQTATQITIAEFKQTVSAVAHDLRAEREHYEKTWEEVDDLLPEMCETEWAIYYSRADELVTALRVEDRELFDEAEQMHRDCFGSDGYDYSPEVRDIQLAYCATEIAVRAEVEAMKSQDIAHNVEIAVDRIADDARRSLWMMREKIVIGLRKVATQWEVTV